MGSAFATDQLTNEIVCSKIQRPGEADNGLGVMTQSNPTAWVKRASVHEYGYLGDREIGAFQVPLNPRIVNNRGSHFMVYETRGFRLVLKGSPAGKVEGPATTQIELPGYDVIRERLICKEVK